MVLGIILYVGFLAQLCKDSTRNPKRVLLWGQAEEPFMVLVRTFVSKSVCVCSNATSQKQPHKSPFSALKISQATCSFISYLILHPVLIFESLNKCQKFYF